MVERRPPSTRERLRSRLAAKRDRIRATRTGKVLLATLIAVAGAVVVAVGLLLVPLPGPGWLIVLAGIAIWSLEFRWARRLLHRARALLHVWTQWVRRQHLLVRFAIGSAVLLTVAAISLYGLRKWFGVDLVGQLLG